MNIREVCSSWPVDNVAAALLDARTGVVDSVGEPDRVFELASVTKLLSAYGVLMAVEEGALELDQPLGPEGSTVRHLLAHASGVGFDSRDAERDVEERRVYSSAGFEWLADAVGKATGISFPDYLRAGVFEPLNMPSTELTGPAGHGAQSTLADLINFANELLNPALLHESTVKEAFQNQFGDLRGIVPGYGMHKPSNWGLGFEIKGQKEPHWTGESMPADTVGHFGMAGTYLWVVPTWSDEPGAGTAMIALTDREFGDWAKPLWAESNKQIWREVLAG